MDTISVRNPATGQVAHFSLTGPNDPRAAVLLQRIARNELERVGSDAESDSPGREAVTLDIHAEVRDEKGDLLKSVHGGGLDPDAAGDALGRPSGSGIGADKALEDAQVAAKAVGKMLDNAEETGAKVSPSGTYPAAAALPADELVDDDGSDDDGALKGAALDKALEDAGLSKTGTAREKRARLADHSQS